MNEKREIKFRAWDGEKMIHLNLYQCSYYKEDFVLRDNNSETRIDDHCGDVEYPIMQYTGLKDKDGKEIYEGDIVLYANLGSERDEYNKIGEIKWEDDSFFIGNYDSLIQAVGNKCIEVKGNIYENPDLLPKE